MATGSLQRFSWSKRGRDLRSHHESRASRCAGANEPRWRRPSWKTSFSKRWRRDRTLRYQHASDMRTDLQRLKRDTETGRLALEISEPLSADEITADRSSEIARIQSGSRPELRSGGKPSAVALASASASASSRLAAPHSEDQRTVAPAGTVHVPSQRKPFILVAAIAAVALVAASYFYYICDRVIPNRSAPKTPSCSPTSPTPPATRSSTTRSRPR